METRTPVAASGTDGAGDTGHAGADRAVERAAPWTWPRRTPPPQLPAARAAAASAERIVYFDFDSYVIKDEFKPTIDVFAKLLSTDKAQEADRRRPCRRARRP